MGGGGAQAVTLANSIIGVGVLAMPFCFQQCGAVLAVVMLLVSGLVSRLTCYYLLKSAIIARRRNFEFLAFHVFGAPGKLAVEVCIIGFLMGTCIAYFVVVGDLGPQIICKMFNINQSDVLRTSVMVIVSLVCVLPLGLLRNVDSLSNVSAATIGFYICLVIKVIAEATSKLFDGDWQSKMDLWKSEGILQCVPIFSMALFCQTQLFEIFETLPVLSLEKMNVVTKNAIHICTAVYVMVGLFGYIAFCTQPISGNILVSLSPTMASDVIKLGFVMSLAFSFPLIIFPCRASLYSLLYRRVLPSHHDHIINHSIPEGTFRCITVGIIIISLLISLMIPNIELVLGLVGSTIGVMICVIFPAACFVNVTIKNTNERVLAKVILCLGIIVMVLGTYANLQAAETNREHYDERYITQDRIDKIVKDFFETSKYNIKSEDAIIKPEIKPANDIIEDHKAAIIEEDLSEMKADKESLAQPPNPVAPVSQTEEKHQSEIRLSIETVKDKPKEEKNAIKLILNSEEKEKQNGFDIEGGGDKESIINGDNKNESEENNQNAIKEVVKDESVDRIVAQSVVNQNNLDNIKQQAVIETVKQHKEEQKELLKEQRELLDELKKSKLEIEKNKKENIDKEQAKKLAVESIQKIANIAIQSLSAAGETSGENMPKLKNYKSDQKELQPSTLQSSNDNIDKSKQNNQEQTRQDPADLIIKKVDEAINKLQETSHINVDKDIAPNRKPVDDEKNNLVPDTSKNKEHIHSPDEPKSYIRGEDEAILSKKSEDIKLSPSNKAALMNNVPVPMVMSQNFPENGYKDNTQKMESKIKEVKPQVNNNQIINGQNERTNEIHSREKRDIIYCTENMILSESDRQLCKIGENSNNELSEDSIDIKILQKLSVPVEITLGKVDLYEHSLLNSNLKNQIRGLKSIDETEPS